ncbi:MAG: hypothetical protein WCI88_12950 [Chloroflexota bacterium]
MPRTATRTSWDIKPMPSSTTKLVFNRSFTNQEFALLSAGLIPKDMEDRWFIFMDGDWLYFHRSWSGFCVYQIRFEQEGEIYVVVKAIANRDPEQYRGTDNQYDADFIGFLIDDFLLGKRVPFPQRTLADDTSE